MHTLLLRRSRELGKTFKGLAADAGLARTYLYKLAHGTTLNPSVRTLVRLAGALEISPVVLFRHFGDLRGASIATTKPLSPSTRAPGLADSDDAVTFNADITIPDHAPVNGGECFRKIWEIQNVGRVTWQGRRLVRVDSKYVIARAEPDGSLVPVIHAHLASLDRHVPIPNTLPGGVVRLHVDFVAPKENCSVVSIWRIEDSFGHASYGPSFILQVIVTVID